jgi:hypothetical protein
MGMAEYLEPTIPLSLSSSRKLEGKRAVRVVHITGSFRSWPAR